LFEAAVPGFSFGGALGAIILAVLGVPVDLRVTAAGCVISSFVLAYLAWVRPKKDIVALTTPIYALIFFAVPLENFTATVILEFLYAVSLTALLVRLKYRFGNPVSLNAKPETLTGPLGEYVERIRPSCAGISPAAGHAAATVILRFAAGEYGSIADEVKAGRLALDRTGCAPAFMRAFEIVEEQARITEKSETRPEWYRTFESFDAPLLAFPVPEKKKGNGYDPGYDTALDNALLLLFAGAWNGPADARTDLLCVREFARRLISA
jgi:hypothetical protein